MSKATMKMASIFAVLLASAIADEFESQRATVSVVQGGLFDDLTQKLRKIQPPQNAIELEMREFFPAADAPEDQSLWHPQDMAFDSRGNFYIIDYKANCVKKYDPSGRFLKNFGRKGQGPGDLSLPYSLRIRKDTIAIIESGNRRLQYFDLEGNSFKTVPIRSFCFSRDIGEDGKIYGTMMRFENQNKLIEVLSPEGSFLSSFGTPVQHQYTWAMANLNPSYLFLDSKEDIVVVFRHLPVLRKYTPKGKLTGESRLEGEIFKIKEEFNKEAPSRMLKGGPAAFSPIFEGVELFDDHLFMMNIVSQRLWIWKIDLSGKILMTFWAAIEDGFLANDVLIRKKDADIVFFILQYSPEARVCAFAPKNSRMAGVLAATGD